MKKCGIKKTKYLIRAENNKSDDYDYKYMKLKNKY